MATGGDSDVERGTDETFENLCSACSRRNKNTEGSKFCTDCQKYFCSVCVNYHDYFPATRNHRILDKAKLIQVKNSKKYTVKEKSDRPGGNNITSVCELDDGTIILSDCVYDKLLRLDSSSYMVRDSCIVPSWPYHVCTINSQEVAICCYLPSLIQFVSIGLTMRTTRQIKTGFNCVGLAYHDQKLFISDELSVYVYTMTGERLQQFSLSHSTSMFTVITKIFSANYLMNIAVSIDGSTIYIAHPWKGLIILNKNGHLVGKFYDSKLGRASDVCLYKNNSVLVCGDYSKNVLQFTPDGKLIGEVLKRDKGCRAVCYCKKTSKLIVGMGDEIEVYDIKV